MFESWQLLDNNTAALRRPPQRLGDSDLQFVSWMEMPDSLNPAAITQSVIRSNSSRIALKTASRALVSAGLLGTVVRRDTNVYPRVGRRLIPGWSDVHLNDPGALLMLAESRHDNRLKFLFF